MAETNTNTQQAQENVPAAGAAAQQEATFTQADVDNIVNKRLERERKKYPGDDELAAFRSWKESQQTEKERWENLTKERDESKAALTAAQAELAQYQREKFLLGKGVSPDDVDYYAFKIGKLVTDELPFEKAAENYLKGQNHRGKEGIQVDFTAPLGGGVAPTPNQQMNSLIRGARK